MACACFAASICGSSGDANGFASSVAVPGLSPGTPGSCASSASMVYDPSGCVATPTATRSPTARVGRVNDTAPASMYLASVEIVAVMSLISTDDSSTDREMVSPSTAVMVPATLSLPTSPRGWASEPVCGPLVDVPRSAQGSAGFVAAVSMVGVAAAAAGNGCGRRASTSTRPTPAANVRPTV